MKKMILLLAIAALGFSSIANATLINRGADSLGNRLIYDTDLNITWYDYTNSVNTWQDQVNWANNLSVTLGSQTFDDWRLPTTVDGKAIFGYNGTTTSGYNITNSEMGHLYYAELGNLGYYDTSGNLQSGYGLTNTGPFEHLLSPAPYWSGTEYLLNTDYAWGIHTFGGGQYVHSKNNAFYALAVSPGDVAAQTNAVPEPSTLLLLGSGLVGLAGMRRRFKKD